MTLVQQARAPQVSCIEPVFDYRGYFDSKKKDNPNGAIALCTSRYVERNNTLLRENVHGVEILSETISILRVYDLASATLQAGEWLQEREKLMLYRDVVRLYTELDQGGESRGSGVVPLRQSGYGTALSLVHGHLSSPDRVVESADFFEFVRWLKRVDSTLVSDISVPEIPQNHPRSSHRGIQPYSLVWSDVAIGTSFLLNPLLLCQTEDPFIFGEVDSIFSNYLRLSSRYPSTSKQSLFIEWFFTTVDVEKDVLEKPFNSSLGRYVRTYIGGNVVPSNRTTSEQFSSQLGLCVLQDNVKAIHQILDRAPAVCALPGLSLSSIETNPNQCIFALSHYIGYRPVSSESILSSLTSVPTTSSCWDFETINRNFGQLGLGTANPVEAIFESNLNIFSSSKIMQLNHLIVLARLNHFTQTGEGVELILSEAVELEMGDTERAFVVELILHELFFPVIVKWIEGSVLVDISVVESALSLTPPATNSKLGKYKIWLELVRLSTLSGGIIEFGNFSIPYGTNISNSDELPNISREALIPVLAGLIVDPPGNNPNIPILCSESSNRLDIKSQVHNQVATNLLAQCYDADVDIYLQDLSLADQIGVIERCVQDRVAVVIKCMSEDTSKLHGLVYTALKPNEISRYINFPITSEETSKNILDWLLSSQDGFVEVVNSCSQLLASPGVSGSLKPIRDIVTRLANALND